MRAFHSRKTSLNRLFLIGLFTINAFFAWAQAPAKIWDKRYGGDAADGGGYTVSAQSGGGFLVVGNSSSGINGDKTVDSRGGFDIWVVKFDANGDKIWDQRFGGDGNDFANGIIKANGGGYILFGTSTSGANGDKSEGNRGLQDYWVVKIDENGAKVWDKTFGTNVDDVLLSLAVTPGGGYVLAGYTQGGVNGDKSDPNKGVEDTWLVKIDENGNKIWDKSYGGNLVDNTYEILSSPGGGYLLCAVSNTNANGDVSEPVRGQADFWVLKIDDAGAKVWDKRYGGNVNDVCNFAILTSDGGYLLGGFSNSPISNEKSEDNRGNNDYWFVKIDANGAKIWDKRFGGLASDVPTSVIELTGGGYLLTGYTDSDLSGDISESTRGNSDYWVIKIDANGAKVWDKRLGGSNIDRSFGVLQMGANEFIITGTTVSDQGNDVSQVTKGSSDYWLVKLAEVTNLAPTDLALAPSDIDENNAVGDVVGTLIATDPDAGNTFTYTLVAGAGSTDNASFTIDGDQLKAAAVYDFETKNSYAIRVRVCDQDNACYEEAFNVTINDLPEGPQPPYDIIPTALTILEHNCPGDLIATLSALDPNMGDVHTFAIVGGADAAAFTVVGNQLRAKISYNFETKTSYEVTLRATDQTNLSYNETFTITILDRVAGNGSNGFVKFVQPAADMPINELNSGYQTVPLWVEVTGAASFPVVVNLYSTGTATYGNAQYPTVGDFYFTAYPTTGIERGQVYSCQPALTLTFTANGVKKINWIIYGDAFYEGDETARLSLSPVTAGVGVSGDEDRTITMIDDEVTLNGALTFAATTPSTATAEGNSGTKLVPIQVTLSGSNSFPVTAQIDYAGSTALFGNTFGKDFHLTGLNTSNQLVFTANGTKTFNVVVMGDVVFESDELVNLNLTSPTGGVTFGSTSRTVTITNDDAPRLGKDKETAENATALTVYPNPTRDLLNVAIQTDRDGEASLRLFDLNGRVVWSQTAALTNGLNRVEITTADLPAGLYTLETIVNGDRMTSKVVKE